MHRDIKLDNILIGNNEVKICDFGISKQIKEGEILKEICGTPAYIAPEVIEGNGYQGFSADLWSLGILLVIQILFRLFYFVFFNSFCLLLDKFLFKKLKI